MIYIILSTIFIVIFFYALVIRKKLLDYNLLSKKNKTFYFYLIQTEWCSSCREINPVWKRLGKHYETQSNLNLIRLSEGDSDIKSMRITGFPTLVLKWNKKKQYYKGKRDFDSIVKFIDKRLLNDKSSF